MATMTARLARRLAAIKKDQNATLREMADLSRKAERKHDALVGRLSSLPEDHPARPALEETRDGLRSVTDFCTGTIRQQTGEEPRQPEYHDSRDEGGKFTTTDSPGHMMRRMMGR